MTVKEKIETLIKIYTRVVTGIFLFICVYLFWYTDEMMIRIIDIAGVHVVGLVCAIAYLPLLTDKEFSKRKMIVMNILYFLSINVTVFVVGYVLKWASFSVKGSLFTIEGMIILIYALMMFISYRIDSNETNKINKKLQERNLKREQESDAESN